MAVDKRKGSTFAEGPHVEAHVVGDVAQTDFDKGSKGRKAIPRRPQELPRQRVEDTINATTTCDSTDALDETSVARVEDMFLGDVVLFDDEPRLVFCAHGYVDDQAQMFGQLYCCLPHSSRCMSGEQRHWLLDPAILPESEPYKP